MTEINVYGTNVQNSGSAPKGSASNPYTQSEYESMLEAGTWPGGYVEGLGYCMKEVVITGSDSEPDSDSDSEPDSSEDPISSDDFDPFEPIPSDSSYPSEDIGPTEPPAPSEDETGEVKMFPDGFPVPPESIGNGPGLRIYSRRENKTPKCVLSKFSVASYDERGGMKKTEGHMSGYFLEREINYSLATVEDSNTAILAGDYKLILGEPWQKYDIYLINVPGRVGIAIHKGNNYINSTGCLLIGDSCSYDKNENVYHVWNCGSALNRLLEFIKKFGHDNCRITIEDSF